MSYGDGIALLFRVCGRLLIAPIYKRRHMNRRNPTTFCMDRVDDAVWIARLTLGLRLPDCDLGSLTCSQTNGQIKPGASSADLRNDSHGATCLRRSSLRPLYHRRERAPCRPGSSLRRFAASSGARAISPAQRLTPLERSASPTEQTMTKTRDRGSRVDPNSR